MEDNLRSYGTMFFNESDIFTDYFMKKYKDNANEAINIPIEVKKIT